MAVVVLAANTVLDDAATLTALNEISLEVLGETPLAGGVDLLAASNLVLGATEGLEGVLADLVTAPHGDENLANVHASNGAVGLAESTTHTGLKPISSSARKHLVDTEHVERGAHGCACGKSPCQSSWSCTCCMQYDRPRVPRKTPAQAVRHKVGAEWEVIDGCLLAAKIVDTDLGVWYTTAVARLDVWFVLLVAVALCWTCRHDCRWLPM